MEENKFINVFRQRCASDERCVQSGDKVWKPLKEQTMSFFKIIPFLGKSARKFSSNRFLAFDISSK